MRKRFVKNNQSIQTLEIGMRLCYTVNKDAGRGGSRAAFAMLKMHKFRDKK